jgi:parallel beta-helix repeat (two copies)
MLLKDSRALIFDNVIKNNEGIGLYIRDKSHGEIKSNKVLSI